MLRKLRIAFSVACGTACLLLIVSWVRSFYYLDRLSWPVSRTRGIEFASIKGQLRISTLRLRPAFFQYSAWGLESVDSESWPAKDEIKEAEMGSVVVSIIDWTIWIPHRFLVLVGITLGAAPWASRRFSLRALLIATTLVAVALGLIVSLR